MVFKSRGRGGKRAVGRRKFVRRAGNGGRKGGSTVALSGFSARTTLLNKVSKRTLRPFPDRMFVWLTINNTGQIAAGVVTALFGFSINSLVLPFNNPGGIASSLPNAITAVATLNPCSLKNLLFNPSTTTGLYNLYRVWRAQIMIRCVAQGIGDESTVTMAPTTGAASYGSVTTMGQGPFSNVAVTTYGASAVTLRRTIDMPLLFGMSKQEYATGGVAGSSTGSFATPPSQIAFQNFRLNTQDGAVLVSPVGLYVKVQFLTEFYQPTDTALLDN